MIYPVIILTWISDCDNSGAKICVKTRFLEMAVLISCRAKFSEQSEIQYSRTF